MHPLRGCLSVASALLPLVAQDPDSPRFRIGMGLGAGNVSHSTDGSGLAGDTSTFVSRLQFEGTSRKGFGGGFRFESMLSDDDLFSPRGFAAAEARSFSGFGHFTYRLQADRFEMPMRAGPIFDVYTLEEQNTGLEAQFTSFGFYTEVAPEFALVLDDAFRWSLYGEFGFGFTGTGTDIDGDSREYDSWSFLFGVEVGTRFRFRKVDFGLAYVGRFWRMDESDPENGQVVLGFDRVTHTAMLTFGILF